MKTVRVSVTLDVEVPDDVEHERIGDILVETWDRDGLVEAVENLGGKYVGIDNVKTEVAQ